MNILLWLSKILTKINNVFKIIEKMILSISVIVMGMVLILNTLIRKSGYSFFFNEELIIIIRIWITFIGISYASRLGRHVRMSAFTDILPKKIRKIIFFLIFGSSSILMFFLVYISLKYVHYYYIFNRFTPALNLPYWIVIAIIPIGFLVTGVQFLIAIVRNIQDKENAWVSSEQRDEYSESF